MINPLRDPESRKAWAFVIMFGGCVVMTAYAVAVLIMRGGQGAGPSARGR